VDTELRRYGRVDTKGGVSDLCSVCNGRQLDGCSVCAVLVCRLRS